jgi:competence protein ComEC
VTTGRGAAASSLDAGRFAGLLAIFAFVLSYILMAIHATHLDKHLDLATKQASASQKSAFGQEMTDGCGAAVQQSPWRSQGPLSSGAARIERFLLGQGFERGPWLTIAFASGIAAWFILGNWRAWLGFAGGMLAICAVGFTALRSDGRFPHLRQALVAVPLLAIAGLLVVWSKSELVGTPPIERPLVTQLSAKILSREEDPAQGRIRLIVATRNVDGRPIDVRLNMPVEFDNPIIDEGAEIVTRVRLVPPAPPMLPGAYNFALTAWFAGLSATGSVLDRVVILRPATNDDWLHRAQTALSHHVRHQLSGAAGAIADAYTSGNQGAISQGDQDAMRNSGLTHLLSISGLHVSAVIGAAYFVAIRLLGLWPWLALRTRLPVLAAGVGAFAGITYTLVSGAQVPTVRSCVGALLVLAALALGREALSLRMLAVGAFFVLLLWPEALAGPSFQLSFAAVLAIIALHSSAPVRRWLGPREVGAGGRLLRAIAGLLLTGAVVELSLMPIGLYHFHRAGLYGVIANVVAIPLTELVTMPLLGLALFLDLFGIGAPVWWLTGLSIDAMLALAHWFARQPGAVTWLPAMEDWGFALFVAGGLWLALWRGQVRLWGLLPILAGACNLLLLRPPDILISGDGRHIGITGDGTAQLLVLHEGRATNIPATPSSARATGAVPGRAGSYSTDTLGEIAGRDGDFTLLSDWRGAQCNEDFCVATINRDGRDWRLLISRGRDAVPERALVAACERVDIAIADRRLPQSCHPAWLKADRALLDRTGGLTIDLASGRIVTVAETQGEHGWWSPPVRHRHQIRPLAIARSTGGPEGTPSGAVPAVATARGADQPR